MSSIDYRYGIPIKIAKHLYEDNIPDLSTDEIKALFICALHSIGMLQEKVSALAEEVRELRENEL